jgi:type IV pilus assembly protein PilM
MVASNRRFAVEVSNSSVRVAEVAMGGRRPQLISVGQISLPARAVVDGVVVDTEAVRSALERALGEGNFSQRHAYLAVAGLRAITREVEVPKVSDAELDRAVRLQALDVIPFPEEKTLLSARPLDEIERADGKVVRRVMLAAAHRDLVDPLVQVVIGAGITPIGIELTSTALIRALYDPSAPAGGPEVIVSIGASLTTVVVHENGQPHFVRTIGEAGESVTAAISGTLDIPSHDAEVMKRGLDTPGPQIRAAAAAARDATASLVNEIRSSIEYYATLPGRSQVRRVIVTGGGSRLIGLFERLQQQLGVPVYAGSCLARLDCSHLERSDEQLAQLDPLVAVVVGLALPDPTGGKRIDLMPPEIALLQRKHQVQRMVFSVAAAILLVLIGLGALRYVDVTRAQSAVAAAQQSVDSLTTAIAADDHVAAEHAAIIRDEALVRPILSDEVNWPLVFHDLRATTPSGISTTNFSGVASTPTTSTATTSAPSTPVLPSDLTPIGTISIDLTGQQLPQFKEWLDAFSASKDFSVATFSPISHVTTPSSQITFSATLAVTGAVRTNRLREFEVPRS